MSRLTWAMRSPYWCGKIIVSLFAACAFNELFYCATSDKKEAAANLLRIYISFHALQLQLRFDETFSGCGPYSVLVVLISGSVQIRPTLPDPKQTAW